MAFEITWLMLCLIRVIAIADASSYISELLVNRTVNQVKAIDLNTKLDNYITEQEQYIANLKHVQAHFEPGRPDATNLENTKHPAKLFKHIRECVRVQHEYTYPDTGDNVKPFNETSILQLMAVLPAREELPIAARGVLRLVEYYNFSLADLINGTIGPFETNALTYDEIIDLTVGQSEGLAQELDIEKEMHTCTPDTLQYLFDMIEIAYRYAVNNDDEDSQYRLRRAKFEVLKASYAFNNCTCSKPMMRLMHLYRYVLNETEMAEKEASCKDITPMECDNIHRPMASVQRYIKSQCKRSWLEILNGNTNQYINRTKITGACYIKHDHSSLLYKGSKIEELTVGAYTIKLAYNVVTDHEIQYIKDIGAPGLERASIINNSPTFVQEARPSFKRTSRTYVMDTLQMKPLTTFRARLEGLFGFAVNNESAENLKIGHYGPTAGFDRHMDILAKPKTLVNDRLATIIVYLNDAIGGITFFDSFGISVVPKKGTAVMFPLYYRHGTNMLTTHHTGCPIVYGEKWIITQWINQFGNEFNYPCFLNSYE